ncbi:MAG: hypothetical protein O9282_09340 [Flavobacterium sp.]|jgi:hypothetical protein|nr:hypothetical protein [Flavobacterium sp.]MCZ8091134.1 hypothetical protein [Flavobacterium sp.]MCZ8331501.1 hypothetical protein [Flavobacterium sp.]
MKPQFTSKIIYYNSILKIEMKKPNVQIPVILTTPLQFKVTTQFQFKLTT